MLKRGMFATAATMLLVACNSPADERREAREQMQEVGQAEAERARAIVEESREGAAEVREERAEALEAWKEAFRAEMQQSMSLTRQIDRRLFALESQLGAWEQANARGDGARNEAARATIETYRARHGMLRREADKIIGMTAASQRSHAAEIERQLDILEDDIVGSRAEAKVAPGT